MALATMALATVILLGVGTASAAGPNDGTWDSQCASEGRCRGDLKLTVTGNQFSGAFNAVGYEAALSGSIADDGTIAGALAGKNGAVKVMGKFSPASSTLIIAGSTCGIPMTCPLTRK